MAEKDISAASVPEEETAAATAEKTAKPKKKHTAAYYAAAFFAKIGLTAAVIWALLTFVAGVHICHDNNAYPFIQQDNSLTIEKKVGGPFGDMSKELSFTVEFRNTGDGDGFVWAKNGNQQAAMPRSGGSFKMKHNDKVEIALPSGVKVKVKENSEGYEPAFSLGGAEAVSDDELEFTFTDSVKLVVTNTLNGTIPSGIAGTAVRSAALVMIPLLPIGYALLSKRKRKHKV